MSDIEPSGYNLETGQVLWKRTETKTVNQIKAEGAWPEAVLRELLDDATLHRLLDRMYSAGVGLPFDPKMTQAQRNQRCFAAQAESLREGLVKVIV